MDLRAEICNSFVVTVIMWPIPYTGHPLGYPLYIASTEELIDEAKNIPGNHWLLQDIGFTDTRMVRYWHNLK